MDIWGLGVVSVLVAIAYVVLSFLSTALVGALLVKFIMHLLKRTLDERVRRNTRLALEEQEDYQVRTGPPFSRFPVL
jgi:hypothetical protein